jgi:hypothetical protein
VNFKTLISLKEVMMCFITHVKGINPYFFK